MILVDTGFLLALAQPNDELHQKAVAWANHVSEPLLVTEYVLWEVVNHLSKPIDRCRAHRIISYVSTDPMHHLVSASNRLFHAGLKLHQDRMDKEWSLTDCISFFIMQERAISNALAYDIHFEQAGFDALLRRDPPV